MNFVTGKADCGEDLLETAFGQVRVYLAQGGFQIFRKNDPASNRRALGPSHRGRYRGRVRCPSRCRETIRGIGVLTQVSQSTHGILRKLLHDLDCEIWANSFSFINSKSGLLNHPWFFSIRGRDFHYKIIIPGIHFVHFPICRIVFDVLSLRCGRWRLIL